MGTGSSKAMGVVVAGGNSDGRVMDLLLNSLREVWMLVLLS